MTGVQTCALPIYDQILEDVQRYFAENHASTIAEAGEVNAERATSLLKELM